MSNSKSDPFLDGDPEEEEKMLVCGRLLAGTCDALVELIASRQRRGGPMNDAALAGAIEVATAADEKLRGYLGEL